MTVGPGPASHHSFTSNNVTSHGVLDSRLGTALDEYNTIDNLAICWGDDGLFGCETTAELPSPATGTTMSPDASGLREDDDAQRHAQAQEKREPHTIDARRSGKILSACKRLVLVATALDGAFSDSRQHRQTKLRIVALSCQAGHCRRSVPLAIKTVPAPVHGFDSPGRWDANEVPFRQPWASKLLSLCSNGGRK
ncbi:hypothetical protein ColLi_13123 [Colletotrichum liriopes]|uniref:Uncharacterized protein n=1 Tax=Colletotrichum liriopes TaxID=708192 RepID=A0AA37H0X3_9PEZI|nr:hypothetical protein ColLi_13123 [Colletotrichum liriopes]